MLALPSIEDNCPMVVLEAMAASVPIVAARVGGVPELITDGRNGVLFDPNDPKDMAAAVEGLLRSPDQAAALAQNGRSSATEKYHPINIARKHLEIYQEVLHHPKPSGGNPAV
jgi:glycosyltransferase involved in cell wall biosynthesis